MLTIGMETLGATIDVRRLLGRGDWMRRDVPSSCEAMILVRVASKDQIDAVDSDVKNGRAAGGCDPQSEQMRERVECRWEAQAAHAQGRRTTQYP